MEVGCAAHARRKFFELHTSTQSPTAAKALEFFGALYAVEREVRGLDVQQRRAVRQEKARPVSVALHTWMLSQRVRATDSTALARALDYSLKRWAALTRYLDDGHLPIDNNWVENQIRPIAPGRANSLLAGSLGQPLGLEFFNFLGCANDDTDVTHTWTRTVNWRRSAKVGFWPTAEV